MSNSENICPKSEFSNIESEERKVDWAKSEAMAAYEKSMAANKALYERSKAVYEENKWRYECSRLELVRAYILIINKLLKTRDEINQAFHCLVNEDFVPWNGTLRDEVEQRCDKLLAVCQENAKLLFPILSQCGIRPGGCCWAKCAGEEGWIKVPLPESPERNDVYWHFDKDGNLEMT